MSRSWYFTLSSRHQDSHRGTREKGKGALRTVVVGGRFRGEEIPMYNTCALLVKEGYNGVDCAFETNQTALIGF